MPPIFPLIELFIKELYESLIIFVGVFTVLLTVLVDDNVVNRAILLLICKPYILPWGILRAFNRWVLPLTTGGDIGPIVSEHVSNVFVELLYAVIEG